MRVLSPVAHIIGALRTCGVGLLPLRDAFCSCTRADLFRDRDVGSLICYVPFPGLRTAFVSALLFVVMNSFVRRSMSIPSFLLQCALSWRGVREDDYNVGFETRKNGFRPGAFSMVVVKTQTQPR